MKIWITGSRGLVGSALQRNCHERRIKFVATSHSDVDISSHHQIKKFLSSHSDITHIINCAAYTHVDLAEKEPDTAFRVNALGPENLGTEAHLANLKLVHLSTDYVFGMESKRPFIETDSCFPVSVYAKTKYEGEQRLLEAFPQACILRTSWIFGRDGKNFVSTLFEKIRKEEKIYIVSDQRNRFTYVDDLAEIILNLLCHSGIFHFANRGETSRFEMAKTMVERAKEKGIPISCKEVIPTSITQFPQGAPRPLYSALDTTKIETLLGVLPRFWDLALKDYLNAL